jgi:hypothetical protein
MRIAALTMCLIAAGAAAQAQDRPLARADLPRSVEARLTAIIENPSTKTIRGEYTLSEVVAGDVVVRDGPLWLRGKIEGDLVVIDADVHFEEGSAVNGDVTIVAGESFGLENAVIGGTITTYGEGFNFFRHDEKVLSVNPRSRRVYRDDDHRDWGRSSFAVRTGWNYNRVEGLPIQFGPIIETGGENPTRLEALGIWRTEVGGPFATERWGYSFRLEQFLGGHRDFRVGASLRSVIDPIEDWQLTKSEASLATLVLHSDYRDYFERKGWSAYAKYAPHASGWSALVEYRDEKHDAEAARDPWTLFDGDDEWRLQPLAAQGRFRSVNGSLQIDQRDDDDFPTRGFYIRGDITRGLSSTLSLATNTESISYDQPFTRGLIDARLYRRVGNDATLSFRGVLGGSLNDQSLPPQFQHALGGAGTLPGYSLFSADCGARNRIVTRNTTDTFFAAYGCDRMAMASAEYRGGFDFHIGGPNWSDDEDEDDWGWDFDASPNWIVFFDAARGWAGSESKLRGASNTGTLYDAGVGIVVGDFGVYGAFPLTGTERSMKFFVRLGPRF